MTRKPIAPSIIACCLCITCLTSCLGSRTESSMQEGDTLQMQYAQLLTLIKHEGYTEAVVKDPWKQNSILHRYFLVPKGTDGDKTAEALSSAKATDGDMVRTPVSNAAVFTSPHCQLLYDLGCRKAISGVCDLPYINMPDIKRRAASGSIMDCGSSMQPTIERIIQLHPEALLVSPFENSGGYGKLDKLHIPIIEAADYMETSPLGRAEWMRFYGLLFSPSETRADSLFAVVETEYQKAKKQAAQMPMGRSILTERKTGGVWYVPGGKSTIAQLLHDAHSPYVFASDTHSGSLSLSPEQVLVHADEIDVWAFKYFGNASGGMMSRADLLREYPGYASLKAFKTCDIYECDTSTLPYFEETSFRPDRLLREFIVLAHPKAEATFGLHYYTKATK